MEKFTDLKIKNLVLKERQYLVTEGEGLYLRISPKGKKTWLSIYRFDGKQRWYGLGHYPETSLSLARQRNRTARGLLDQGLDPSVVERQNQCAQRKAEEEERQAPTVATMVEDFLKWHVGEKAPRSFREYERNLKKDVLPEWGHRKVKDITRRDVILLLEKILDRGAKNQANQVFKITRAMFNFGVPRYDLEYSPCTHVKMPSKENRRERFLSEEEIRTLWQNLDTAGMSESIKKALKLILITGQRPGEVIGAHPNEIDGHWWTIPGERAKNSKEHRVHLTPLALEVLGPITEGYFFPSPRSTDKPIEVNALANAVRRNKEHLRLVHWTPHDLRRTCATYLGQAGFSDEVIGKVLNHTRAGVTSRYNRYAYDEEKRKALETWERKLENLINEIDTKIIPFPRKGII